MNVSRKFRWVPGLFLAAFLAAPTTAAMAQESPVDRAVDALVDGLSAEQQVVRGGAERALIAMGPRAKSAVPRLIELVQAADDDRARSAIEVLGAIGPDAADAVPVLGQVIFESGEESAIYAADALGKIGPAAQPVVERLTANAREGEPLTRARAIMYLQVMGPVAVSSAPELVALLKRIEAGEFEGTEDDSFLDRSQIFYALRHFGPAAREAALPTLLGYFADESAEPESAIIEAVVAVGGDDERAIAIARRFLHSNDPYVPSVVLWAIGPDHAALTDDVWQVFIDGESHHRPDASYALARIGSERVLVEFIGVIETSADRDLQKWAALALRKFGAKGAPAVPALMKLSGTALLAGDTDLSGDALSAAAAISADVAAERLQTADGADLREQMAELERQAAEANAQLQMQIDELRARAEAQSADLRAQAEELRRQADMLRQQAADQAMEMQARAQREIEALRQTAQQFREQGLGERADELLREAERLQDRARAQMAELQERAMAQGDALRQQAEDLQRRAEDVLREAQGQIEELQFRAAEQMENLQRQLEDLRRQAENQMPDLRRQAERMGQQAQEAFQDLMRRLRGE